SGLRSGAVPAPDPLEELAADKQIRRLRVSDLDLASVVFRRVDVDEGPHRRPLGYDEANATCSNGLRFASLNRRDAGLEPLGLRLTIRVAKRKHRCSRTLGSAVARGV